MDIFENLIGIYYSKINMNEYIIEKINNKMIQGSIIFINRNY